MHKSITLFGFWLAASAANVALAQNGTTPPPSNEKPPAHRTHVPATRTEVQAQVRTHFTALDRNKDGFITPDELRTGRFHRAGAEGKNGQAARDHLFAMMDKDGNGQISKAEFDAFRTEHMQARRERGPDGAPREEHAAMDHHDGMAGRRWRMHRHMVKEMMAMRMFRNADANHDGKVSLAEAETAALARFDKVDTNHDGTISNSERMAARDAMRTRFAERMHRDGGWDGWHRKADAPASSPSGAPQGTDTH